MKHQPFEDLLFSEEPLTTQEKAALQEHLQECMSCRLLAAGWQEVEDQLHRAPQLAPEPGFTLRWQARLEADRKRFHRRQSLALLSFIIGGTVLLLGSIAILAWPVFQSPSILFWSWVYEMVGLMSYAFRAQELFLTYFQGVTGAIPWIWFILFVGVISQLAVLWFVSFRLLTNPRRIIE